MKRTGFQLPCLVLFVFFSAVPVIAGERPLLHWTFDVVETSTAKDDSGNELNAKLTAELVESPAGQAARMDGDSARLVSITLPEENRLGVHSWTIMAMLRPQHFHYDGPQNQRRIVSYGGYPETQFVVDIRDTGLVNVSLPYQDTDGRTRYMAALARFPLVKNAWNHLAVVCDRPDRMMRIYVNGVLVGHSAIPEEFNTDFNVNGNLTIGSSWHNYIGLVDDVAIYRSALSADSVQTNYEKLRETFKPVDSPELARERENQRLLALLNDIRTAWKRNAMDEVRSLARGMIDSEHAPAHFRSYAHLRIAQSYLAEKNPAAAIHVYETIAGTAGYPDVHREEARQSDAELKRLADGEPLCDLRASRTDVPMIEAFEAELFVGIDGRDENPGTRQEPFPTLTRARDEVRKLKSRGIDGPIAVTILPGRYPITESLQLSAEDSGAADAPVVYRAAEQGTVVLYGGHRLSGFTNVTDEAIRDRLPDESRDKVLQCDLKSLGIDDYGELKVRGFGQGSAPPTLELFIDGKAMPLARWPNLGFVGIGRLVHPGSPQDNTPSIFEYLSDRHERWIGAKDAWLFGYFKYLWADSTIEIAEIDPVKKTITTATAYRYGGTGMDTRQGIQYYAFNLLEEIDMPGEWYLDRSSGVLYLYPRSEQRPIKAEIGLLSSPMIQMSGVSHVQIRGITFDLGRSFAVEAASCHDCWFIGCTISRFAGDGFIIRGGTNNRAIGLDVNRIGRAAMLVSGGDRNTLAPGGHVVENCKINNFGRIDRTYTPAIRLEGVGNRVAHNQMFDGPSSAMRIEGNDHTIEFNEVHSMVKESDDQGAIDMFRNPTYRGVVFRHNYFHQIGKTDGGAEVHGQAAIRFDDAISGMVVYGNVFRQCGAGNFGALQINSGRDNTIDNNLFIECKQGLTGGWRSGNTVWQELRTGKPLTSVIQTDLYLKRYPQIATMMNEPGINHLWRNVFYNSGPVTTRSVHIDLFENHEFDGINPGLKMLMSPDLGISQTTPAQQAMPFKPIPFRQIGLYESLHRAGGHGFGSE